MSSWERVSQHDQGGVNDDLPATSRCTCDLSSPTAAIHMQGHLIIMSLQVNFVPLAVVQAMREHCQVEVSISEVVENS